MEEVYRKRSTDVTHARTANTLLEITVEAPLYRYVVEEYGLLTMLDPVWELDGIDPVGIEPVGMDPVGIDPVGIDPVGIDPVGIDPAEIKPSGTVWELKGVELIGTSELELWASITDRMIPTMANATNMATELFVNAILTRASLVSCSW